MKHPPRQELVLPTPGATGAKVGSNLRSDATTKPGIRLTPALRLLQRRAKALRREGARLFSRAERRIAAQLIAQWRQEYLPTAVRSGSDARRWRASREAVRRELERELARALPNYRAWRRLLRAYQKERQRRLREHRRTLRDLRVHIDRDEVAPPASERVHVFTAPFTLFTVGRREGSMEFEDHSVAVPGVGHLVNNFEVEQTDDGPIPFDVFGLDWLGFFEAWAGCGVNFTMPATGRLRIGAGLQNLYSRIRFGAEDRLGFSQAELEISVRLFVEIRDSERTYVFERELVSDGLSSHGSELTGQFPPFESDAIYSLDVTTATTFAANRGLQILAGADVWISSEIDDMRTYVDTLLWWQLKTLTVETV